MTRDNKGYFRYFLSNNLKNSGKTCTKAVVVRRISNFRNPGCKNDVFIKYRKHTTT